MDYIFTHHVEYKIKKRKFTKDDVIFVVRYYDKLWKKHGKYYAQKKIGGNIIEVVHERKESYINIITLYVV